MTEKENVEVLTRERWENPPWRTWCAAHGAISGEWCPLCDPLPVLDCIESSPQFKCIELVEEARTLWTFELSAFDEEDCCHPRQEQGLPLLVHTGDDTRYLPTEGLAACEIVDRMQTEAPFMHVCLADPAEDWVIEDGKPTIRHDLLSRSDIFIRFMRGRCPCAGGSVPDYAVLAMAAIGEAWYLANALNEQKHRRDPEFNPKDGLLLARELLARACAKYAATVTEPLIEKAERDKGVRLREAAKGKRKKAEEVHREWQHRADRIWTKHPDWPASRVATKIADELAPENEIYSGTDPDWIRKNIRKKNL